MILLSDQQAVSYPCHCRIPWFHFDRGLCGDLAGWWLDCGDEICSRLFSYPSLRMLESAPRHHQGSGWGRHSRFGVGHGLSQLLDEVLQLESKTLQMMWT